MLAQLSVLVNDIDSSAGTIDYGLIRQWSVWESLAFNALLLFTGCNGSAKLSCGQYETGSRQIQQRGIFVANIDFTPILSEI